MNSTHNLFPVGMSSEWRAPDSVCLAPHLLDWLENPSSLTARLKSHAKSFRVQVLGQALEKCSNADATDDIVAGQEVLVREVILWCDNTPQVFARSILPISSLTGEQQALGNLGEQPLGQVLFNHPDLKRKCIEVAPFYTQSSLKRLCKHLSLSIDHDLYARRSTFLINKKPVVVSELFLPNAFAYSPEKR